MSKKREILVVCDGIIYDYGLPMDRPWIKTGCGGVGAVISREKVDNE